MAEGYHRTDTADAEIQAFRAEVREEVDEILRRIGNDSDNLRYELSLLVTSNAALEEKIQEQTLLNNELQNLLKEIN